MTHLERVIRLHGIQRALVAESFGFQQLLHIRQLFLQIRILALGVFFLLYDGQGRR